VLNIGTRILINSHRVFIEYKLLGNAFRSRYKNLN